ncbi:MAG: ClpXP protease specificity-enhancing factor [Gallionellaceae bacterium]|nr:MAG: ClpXP protease specificity-enhancing factor [Gallionellaceae bacterium]
MSDLSTKPYLIRAIHDWCADSGLTPYLAVQVDEHTQVPMGYVKDGKIVLNISVDAVRNLHMGNEDISCSGRFGGVSHQIMVPVAAVMGIFAKENGQGLVFQGQNSSPLLSDAVDGQTGGSDEPPDSPVPQGKPKLRVVK